MILFLQRQLTSERALNLALLKQLEEKDRQIAMVLERHYEQHVVRSLTPAPEPQVAVDAATLDEAARFDPQADRAQLAKEQAAFENASRALDAELEDAFQGVATEHQERRDHPRAPGAFKEAEDAGHAAAREVTT